MPPGTQTKAAAAAASTHVCPVEEGLVGGIVGKYARKPGLNIGTGSQGTSAVSQAGGVV